MKIIQGDDDQNDQNTFFYKTSNVLGRGSFGEVCRGRRKKDNLKVAIKKIECNEAQNKNLKDFLNEIAVMQKANNNNNQNLVKILHHTQTNRNFYIIMEYCEGGNLIDYISKQKINENKKENEKINYLPEAEAKHIFKEIVKGYKQLYDSKIVHRDIKPQNILMDENGVPKISDFGASKILEDYASVQNMVTFAGTPVYMAPQVTEGNYTNKADVWSLGVTFYRVLFGELPWKIDEKLNFQSNQIFQAAYQQIKGDEDGKQNLPFPSQPEVSNEMKNIIAHMLQLKEKDRMSCEELIQTFQKL